MFRTISVACVLSWLAASAWAQAQPASGTAATPSAPPAKTAAKKPAPKAKTAAKPPAPADTGPCQIGVIPAIGDKFVVQKVGLMVFGNAETEVPIEAWGLDDLAVARVRAAAPGIAVRRIAYPKGVFEPYYNPSLKLFRNPDNDLADLVRQITANASCARYVVVTTFTAQLGGTNQTTRGIGVLNHGTSLFSRTSLFAHISVKVLDGQSFAVHKNPFANLGSMLSGTLSHVTLTLKPLTELDNTAFPEPATEAANSAILRNHTRALLTAYFDKTLPEYLKEE